MDSKDFSRHIEDTEVVSESTTCHGAGTVRLFDKNTTILIPTPSPDPKDPLNLPAWRKWTIVFGVGAFSATAVLITSGLGSIFTSIEASYPGQEARATDLLTYPTLFMGIGNLAAMPLSVAIGRRPIFLMSLVLLVASGIWCAVSKDLGSHIAGRNVLSLAAGQSEALAPLIVEEVHFLHERGTRLAWFVVVQGVGTACMFLATSYMVPAWGWRWWYGVFTIVNGLLLVFSYFFVVESRFDRPASAAEGAVHLHTDENGQTEVAEESEAEKIFRVTTAQNHVLDPERYGPRTWAHDLRIFHFKPDWKATLTFYRETCECLCVPSVFWLVLLNGAYLGVYVFQASQFATILLSPPFSFKFQYLGFVQAAQIIDCMAFLPILGYGSDLIIKMMSKWNKGIYEPEYRLIILAIPTIAVILSCVLFGQAGQHPYRWNWPTVAISYNLEYFAFIGANVVALTYSIDSFPRRAGPVLLLICAGRGFISFGLSYSTIPFIKKAGYDGAMNVFAIICGVLSVLAVPCYVWGKRCRVIAQSWFDHREEKSR